MNKYTLVILLFLITNSTVSLSAQNKLGVRSLSVKAYDGYTLITPTMSNVSYLINNQGEIVNQWMSKQVSQTANYLTNDGHLIKACISSTPTSLDFSGRGGWIEKRDWNNDLLWSYDFNTDTETTNHDLAIIPNGNLLILFTRLISAEDSFNLGKTTSTPTYATVVKEIEIVDSNDINIIWEWDISDHLAQDVDPTKHNFFNISNTPNRVDINYASTIDKPNVKDHIKDIFHANAIDYNPQLDLIMITLKHYSEVIIIDHSTSTEEGRTSAGGNYKKGGDILYRYGNPSTYKSGSDSKQQLYEPHSAVWIDQGLDLAGHIMVFNNEYNRNSETPRHASEVICIQSPFSNNNNSNANIYEQDYILFQYGGGLEHGFFSKTMSSVQVLPNNNILINIARGSILYEVTPDKEIVWHYVIPTSENNEIDHDGSLGGNGAYNVNKYPKYMKGFSNRDLSPKSILGLFGNKYSKVKTKSIDSNTGLISSQTSSLMSVN